VISVVIPARDAGAYLAEAVASVLAQDAGEPLDVIVVDDGSADDTAAIARSFGSPVRCLGQPHAGAAAARNAGIAAAQGELVAFLDADDLWVAEKLALQVRALAADRALEGVFGHVCQFRDAPVGERSLTPPQPGYMPGTLLIRAPALRRLSPFDPGRPRSEVLEWSIQALGSGVRLALRPEVVLHRRVHASNTGVRERAAQHREYLAIVRAALGRRRQAR
jgi:glycosyltransferase involved in cell wall biosynthesis